MQTTLIIILTIYISICLFFYFFQHYFFFRPEILPKHFTYKFPFPFEELNFSVEDGGNINAIYFKVPKSRGIVFYLKGNSRSIKGWGKFAKDFLSNGYDFIMMDYRGFGKSKGHRNQTTLFNDAQFMYQWINESYPESKIILYGRSLGSGVAARIAGWHHPRMLILDSPYFSFYHNIRRYLFYIPLRWLMRYDLRTDIYLETSDCPVHIIHGTQDRLIPFAQSIRLKELFPDKITLHPVQGASHNNLPEYQDFYKILYEILYIKPESAWPL